MAQEITKRHPIRGFIWGILFGLGLALIGIGQGYAALGTWPPLILLIVGIVLGTLWGLFAPSKKPKGEPPREQVQVESLGSSQPEPSSSAPTAAAAAADADDSPDGESASSEDSRHFAASAEPTKESADPNERELSLGELASNLDDDPQSDES